MSADVDAYISNAPDGTRTVASRVREVVTAQLPEAEEAFLWARPTYKINGKVVCYLTASKGHVTLGFGQGRELTDPDGLLEGSGKQMAHIKLRRPDDIDEQRLRGWLDEARQLALQG